MKKNAGRPTSGQAVRRAGVRRMPAGVATPVESLKF
jgi:hypothetical protein